MTDIINEVFIVSFLGYLIIVNVLTFILYAIDKRRSIKKQWRISESTLLLFTLALGGFGAFCAMRFLRHKTQKFIFKGATTLSLILIVIATMYLML